MTSWKERVDLIRTSLNEKNILIAQRQAQEALERIPNHLQLLAIANDAFRASGDREKSLEYAQRMISHYPRYCIGYARVAHDLLSLKRFEELRAFCGAARDKIFSGDIKLLGGLRRASDACLSALEDMLNSDSHIRASEFSEKRKILVPIGDFCVGARFVQSAGGRRHALPFDWVFANPEIVQQIIGDNFSAFLDQEYLQSQYPERRCGHSLYGVNLFNHHDPSREPDRSSFWRRVMRLRGLLSSQHSDLLFFNVRMVAKVDDLISLLGVLPSGSKILSFVFLGGQSHEAPVVRLLESRILQYIFTCDAVSTAFARQNPHSSGYTDGCYIYCPYSATYAQGLLELVSSNC